MTTEILLMTDIPDLGAEGDIVKVADGYARNYLLPRKLGAPVVEATRRRLAKIRQQRDLARKAEIDTAREIAAKLGEVSCTIAAKVGENGKLYGSVTVADIADALKAQEIEIDKHCLMLEEPIKDIGVFDVKVKLDSEVESSVRVWVVEE